MRVMTVSLSLLTAQQRRRPRRNRFRTLPPASLQNKGQDAEGLYKAAAMEHTV